MLGLEELRSATGAGQLDTVVVAFTDMQGRLVGKRLDAGFFLELASAGSGVEACDYLLAVDMEMTPVPGYEVANWETGYGDFVLRPDMATLMAIPWLPGTALVLSDVVSTAGEPVAVSPRQVLKRQVERARALGLEAAFGSELEFYLLKETYEQARQGHYLGLTPSVPYILDYHLLATSYDEPFLRRVRTEMSAAGIPVESSKGEAWPGQHEVNLRYAQAVTMADRHAVYKTGAKEIAQQSGCSITFMAKPSEDWMGSSCHVHASLWRDGSNAFAAEPGLFGSFLAGQLACARELAVLVAPAVNSYKRYATESWAPTRLVWGRDNRTCAFRVVGEGPGLRVEDRLPGADANPYLAFSAVLAAGLHGIDAHLEPPPAFDGNAYASSAPSFPASLAEAIAAWEGSAMARHAFGEDVVAHYLHYARTEQKMFDRVVTCYERDRMFERG
ncbi:MAG: glutamine synthetase family protein [Acidimicrobiales bacterium]